MDVDTPDITTRATLASLVENKLDPTLEEERNVPEIDEIRGEDGPPGWTSFAGVFWDGKLSGPRERKIL